MTKPGVLRQVLAAIKNDLSISVYLLVITIVAAVVLDFIRTPKAEFSLSAQTTAVNFQSLAAIKSEPVVAEVADIAQIGAASVNGSAIDGLSPGQAKINAAKGKPFTIDLDVPAEWTVSAEAKEPSLFSLFANPPESSKRTERAKLTITAAEGTTITVSDADGKKKILMLPRDAQLVLTAPYIDVELRGGKAKLFEQIDPRILTLTHRYKSADEQPMEEGAALSGTLWVDHAQGLPASLGPIDQIVLHDIEEGLLRTISWDGSALTVSAHGRAGQIGNRLGSQEKELRPSVLAVLRDNGLLQVMLAIITFFAGLEISTFLRRSSQR